MGKVGKGERGVEGRKSSDKQRGEDIRYSEWRGKGQLYIAPDSYLMWKKSPHTEATHLGGVADKS